MSFQRSLCVYAPQLLSTPFLLRKEKGEPFTCVCPVTLVSRPRTSSVNVDFFYFYDILRSVLLITHIIHANT